MDNQKTTNKKLRTLFGYYGLLQISHLLSLVRAGIIYLNQSTVPFPAPPPPGGWDATVIPFLFAMGGLDGIAAAIGIAAAYQYVFKKKLKGKLVLISLVMALTSAGIFAVGTIASGAWAANPFAYGVLVVLFAPLFPLFYYLLRQGS